MRHCQDSLQHAPRARKRPVVILHNFGQMCSGEDTGFRQGHQHGPGILVRDVITKQHVVGSHTEQDSSRHLTHVQSADELLKQVRAWLCRCRVQVCILRAARQCGGVKAAPLHIHQSLCVWRRVFGRGPLGQLLDALHIARVGARAHNDAYGGARLQVPVCSQHAHCVVDDSCNATGPACPHQCLTQQCHRVLSNNTSASETLGPREELALVQRCLVEGKGEAEAHHRIPSVWSAASPMLVHELLERDSQEIEQGCSCACVLLEGDCNLLGFLT
mmetsp:Transcript_19097/g.32761  ORF Transcript_19097/g.32761 Transcript_19097/m.32761 type:complete len:274 (+) Transcript_19097:2089-2910(+)